MSDLFDEWGVDDDLDDDEMDEDELGEDDLEEGDFEDGDLDDLDDFDEDDLDDLLDEDEEEDDDDADGEDDDEDLELGDELDSDLAGSVEVSCPYCGAGVELIVDPVGGETQEYVEDCEVCCQPWSVRVMLDPEGSPSVDVTTLDDG